MRSNDIFHETSKVVKLDAQLSAVEYEGVSEGGAVDVGIDELTKQEAEGSVVRAVFGHRS
jgi:hypothetical protein